MEWTNEEMRNMHLIYGESKQNSRKAASLYQQRFPTALKFPREDVFRRLDKRLLQSGSFLRPKKPGM